MISLFTAPQSASKALLEVWKMVFSYHHMFTFLLLPAACLSGFSTSLLFFWSLVVLIFNLNRRNSKNRPPGLSMIQMMKFSYDMFKANVQTRRRLILEYMFGACMCYMKEDIFSSGLPNFFFFRSPDAVKEVLRSKDFLQKGQQYNATKLFLKDGLVTSSGKKWQARRKLITPAFHSKIIEEFIPIFDKQAKILLRRIDELMQNQESIDIVPLTGLCALDVILETSTGTNLNAQEARENEYFDAVQKSEKIIASRIISPWLWNDFIFFRTKEGKELRKCCNTTDAFIREVINKRKEDLIEIMKCKKDSDAVPTDNGEGRKLKKLALLDLLLDAHFIDPNFTLEDVAEEIGSFIPAGHDTISHAINWTLYLLGLNQSVQRKVHEEVDVVLGNDTNKIISSEDIKQLTYLHCVFKETLRLYPIIPLIVRMASEDAVISGHKIKRGTNVVMPIYMLHRNPDVFPNPEEFNPDRFNQENRTNMHSFAYIPFAAGPRNCIGQKFATLEALTVLATILRKFSVTAMEHRDKIKLSFSIVMVSENGIKLKFAKRQI